jgi:hypothetical protein
LRWPKSFQLERPHRIGALAGRAAEEARKLARARVELERVGLESDSPIDCPIRGRCDRWLRRNGDDRPATGFVDLRRMLSGCRVWR